MKTVTKTMTGLAMTMVLASGCTADIRPDAFAKVERVSPDVEQRGRALLARAAEVHGAASFGAKQTYTMVIHDEWRGIARMMNPWPEHDVDVRLSYRSGSFDARAEFLSGEEEGKTWGMQAWKTYTAGAGEEPMFEQHDDAAFILPAIQYLNEFVFRSHDDQLVSYLGTEEIRGKTYERVFVTWESLTPSASADQYIVYIDPDTGRVDKIGYTVRDIMKWFFVRFGDPLGARGSDVRGNGPS